tara:strand:- start:5212 stop:5412 length:201 start_codon:yes stop_codon:yes gene_type:complete
MKKFFLISFLIVLSNCSFNDEVKKRAYNEKLKIILDKSNDLMSLTFDEYFIYINEYSKNSKYPNLD